MKKLASEIEKSDFKITNYILYNNIGGAYTQPTP